jgi:hypothetical protein
MFELHLDRLPALMKGLRYIPGNFEGKGLVIAPIDLEVGKASEPLLDGSQKLLLLSGRVRGLSPGPVSLLSPVRSLQGIGIHQYL